MSFSGRLAHTSIVALGFVISVSGITSAQPASSHGLRPEVFVSGAAGVVFHGIDDDIPVRPNIGGSIAVRATSRVGVEFEVNANLGRSERWGHVGVASVSAAYFFSSDQMRPYASGGIGALWSDQTFVDLRAGTFEVRRDTGVAWNAGLGVLIPVTAAISLRPEFRGYSSRDLRIFRPSIAVGIHW